LIFSQANVAFYYYENEKGYTLADYSADMGNGVSGGGGSSGASLYYDDGLYFAGYTDADSLANSGAGSSSGSNNGINLGNSSTGSNGSSGGDTSSGSID
jgi:hypothetical protein